MFYLGALSLKKSRENTMNSEDIKSEAQKAGLNVSYTFISERGVRVYFREADTQFYNADFN